MGVEDIKRKSSFSNSNMRTQESRPEPAGVRVKLIGVLASAAGKRELALEFQETPTISDVVSRLISIVGNRQFEDFLVDSASRDPRPNVIILVNEQDSNLFGGLKAKVQPGNTITIIPVAHGG